VLDYLKGIGSSSMVERYRSWQSNMQSRWGNRSWYQLSPQERRDIRALRPLWWGIATKNTLDRATAIYPKLMRERLDETGIDYTVLYTGLGLFAPRIEEEDLRRAVCRAFNKFKRRPIQRTFKPHDPGGNHSDVYAAGSD
jgi:hypothetical protein